MGGLILLNLDWEGCTRSVESWETPQHLLQNRGNPKKICVENVKYSPYRAVNTFRLSYKNQPVNAV